MYRIGDTVIASATDLVGYLACDHLVTLELDAASGRIKRPIRNDPELELIQKTYADAKLGRPASHDLLVA